MRYMMLIIPKGYETAELGQETKMMEIVYICKP